MSSSENAVELMKTQMKILAEIENKLPICKNHSCAHDHGFKISKNSSTYTLTTKLEPFSENDVVVSSSEDKQFLIVDAKNETLFDYYHMFHQVTRKFKIPDEYDLNNLEYKILDGILTITIGIKRAIIKESENQFATVLADQEKVTLQETTPHKKSAKDADLIPIRVIQSSTIDPSETVPEPITYYNLPEIKESHIQYDEKGFGDRPDIGKLIDDMWKKAIKDKKAKTKSITSLTMIDACAPGTSKSITGDMSKKEDKKPVKEESTRNAQIVPEPEAEASSRKNDVEENIDEEQQQTSTKTIPEATRQEKEAEQNIYEKRQQMDVKISEVICQEEGEVQQIYEVRPEMSDTETEQTVEDVYENVWAVASGSSSQDGIKHISKDVCVREEGRKAGKEHDTEESKTPETTQKVYHKNIPDKETYEKKTLDVRFQEGTSDSKTQGKTPESKTLEQTPGSKAPEKTPDSKKKKKSESKKKVEVLSKEVKEGETSKAGDRKAKEEEQAECEPETSDETGKYEEHKETGGGTIENKSDEKTKGEEDPALKRKEKKDDGNDPKKSEHKTPPRPVPHQTYGSGKMRGRGRGRR